MKDFREMQVWHKGKELKQFLTISMGSASEVEYQIMLSYELRYMDRKTYDNLNNDIQEIKKMLSSYIVKIGNQKSELRNQRSEVRRKK